MNNSNGWMIFLPCVENPRAEVIPQNDFREHAGGLVCWCKPKIDGAAIVHNAMDQREYYERGERILT